MDHHIDKAVTYFRFAANGGHFEAQQKVVKYYVKGKGVQRNLMSATQILLPAAEQGNKEAKRKVRRL